MVTWTQTLGYFANYPVWGVVAGFILVLLALGYTGAPLWLWSVAGLVALWGVGAPIWLNAVYVVLALIFNIRPLRRLISGGIMKMLDALQFLPKISQTERTAIEAGTVWVEGELFSGKPNFDRFRGEKYADLSEKERAFLDGPTEELCRMVSDWDVFVRKGFTDETWTFMKSNGFFGLIIPESYGGHGFSPSAHSAIVTKLASRCGPLATTVMVPNSLGPAELLIHYGTEDQKDHYLPRLATGEEMPCFAMTEPTAGSDAGAMRSRGEVFKGDDGKLYLRLNWDKRYITLAAISTVIGLAFKLHDPENLLGKGTDLGITCALIPSDTEGVKLDRRHDPLGVPFWNCPTEGHDVVVPVDSIIGGREQAGNGWRMLMESLSVGRGISLPAQSMGGARIATRAIGAYSVIRRQFGLNIGKFEGIEEPMARIGGFTYLMDAARRFTCGGLDSGAKPAVVTAMAKYNFTELYRKLINDAMDIVGGAGISRGPRNIFAHGYIAAPIAITVEGANILTRTLMIFGQGAIRSHPYAYKEIDALTRKDVKAFDDAFWKHIGLTVRNGFRAKLLSLTRGHLARSPFKGPGARYYRKLSWASATFAFLTDIALMVYGGKLKRKEKLSGRYADVLSWMYLAAATLRRYEEEGSKQEDRPLLDWSVRYAFSRIQEALDGIYRELKIPGLSWAIRGPVSWWHRLNPIGTPPSDKLSHKVASIMQKRGEQRDRLTVDMFIPDNKEDALGRLENTLRLIEVAEPAYRKLHDAVKAHELPRKLPRHNVDEAEEKGILTSKEADAVRQAEKARYDAVQVDDFSLDEYINSTPSAPSTMEKGRLSVK